MGGGFGGVMHFLNAQETAKVRGIFAKDIGANKKCPPVASMLAFFIAFWADFSFCYPRADRPLPSSRRRQPAAPFLLFSQLEIELSWKYLQLMLGTYFM